MASALTSPQVGGRRVSGFRVSPAGYLGLNGQAVGLVEKRPEHISTRGGVLRLSAALGVLAVTSVLLDEALPRRVARDGVADVV
jgi:hypothetical protein